MATIKEAAQKEHDAVKNLISHDDGWYCRMSSRNHKWSIKDYCIICGVKMPVQKKLSNKLRRSLLLRLEETRVILEGEK